MGYAEIYSTINTIRLGLKELDKKMATTDNTTTVWSDQKAEALFEIKVYAKWKDTPIGCYTHELLEYLQKPYHDTSISRNPLVSLRYTDPVSVRTVTMQSVEGAPMPKSSIQVKYAVFEKVEFMDGHKSRYSYWKRIK